MKKIIPILIIALFGCSQPNNLPEPISTTTPTATSYQQSSFEGSWNCYDWIVDEITATTHHRKIIFSNPSNSTMFMSLDDYSNSGIITQLISNSGVLVDSNYFDNQANPNGMMFKGVLTSDSTLMLYQYHVVGNSIDTSQVKEFLKQ